MSDNLLRKLRNPIYPSKITMSYQQLKVYSPTLGHKSYTLKAKKLDHEFERITDKLISLTSLNDITSNISGQSLKELESYVKNLGSKDFICLVMSLFYFRDGNRLPQAYTLLMGSNQKVDPNHLKKLCDLCITRLSEYKLHKTNTVHKNVSNLDQILNSSIKACLYFINKTNLSISPDLTQLKVTLDEMINEVQYLIGGKSIYNQSLELESHKMMSPVYYKYSLTANLTAPLVLGCSTLSDCSPYVADICHLNHPKALPNYAESLSINTGAQSIAGVLWGLCQYSESLSLSNSMGQLLGYYKSGILKLVQQIHSLSPDALTQRELNDIKEILSIRRGPLFVRLNGLVKGTRSNKELDRIIKATKPQINRAANQETINSPENGIAQGVDVSNNVNEKLNPKNGPLLIGDLKSNIRHLLKQSLQNNYNPLLHYISSYLKFNSNGGIDFNNTDKKVIDFIQCWVFRYDGFSGTLWMHLQRLRAKDNNKDQNLLNLDKIVEQISLSANNQIKKMISYDYSKFYILLSQYQSKNRYTTVLDIQNYLIATKNSEKLSTAQKNDLLSYLNEELVVNADNKFKSIRVKRSMFVRNTAIAALCYQGINLNPDAQCVGKFFTASGNNVPLPLNASVAASGIGWGFLSTLGPFTKYVSIGNTMTYKSIEQFVTLQLQKTTSHNQENISSSSQTVLVKQKAIEINTLIGRLANRPQNPEGIRDEIILKLENIKENNLDLAYCVLTSFVDGQTLIQKLFAINHDDFIKEVNYIWKNVVVEWLNKYDPIYISLKTAGKDAQGNPSDFILFKRYLASVSLDYKQNAILTFYRVMALINIQNDRQIRIKMLEYFANLIKRAKSDNTSVWANLRKMNENKVLFIAGVVRSLGAISWGVGSSLLCATGIGATALIPMLMLLDGVRGVIYGLSNYFEYENSKEYKSAVKFLARSCQIESVDLQDKLKPKAPNLSAKYYSKVSCRVLDQFIYELPEQSENVDFDTIKQKFENLSDYSDDKMYIEQLNKCSLRYDQNKSEKNHQDMLDLFGNICNELSYEVADKYTATEVLFRMVRIIMLSKLSANDKARVLICFAYMARSRSIRIFEILATQRNFFTRRNYLIPDFIFGVSASSTTNAGVAGFYAVYQTLCGGLGDSVGWLTLNLCFNNSNYSKTKSFNASLEFLKRMLSSLLLTKAVNDDLTDKIDLIIEEKIDNFEFTYSDLSSFARFPRC